MDSTEDLHWYCRNCGLNADNHLQVWTNQFNVERYLCGCGLMGGMSDIDAPLRVSIEEHDKYWFELQNDKTFQILRNSP